MEFALSDDNRIYDISTGEVVENKEFSKLKLIIVQEETDELNKIKRLEGSNETYVVAKIHGEKSNCVFLKKGYTFGKVLRVDVQKLMLSGVLGKNARLIIATLEPFISHPRNSILIHSKTPSMKELENIIGLKKTMLYEGLNELENNDIIKRVKSNGQIVIYFNPFLYASGTIIHEDTYELFKYSEYNPNLPK